jgi:hypothetical protein
LFETLFETLFTALLESGDRNKTLKAANVIEDEYPELKANALPYLRT